MANWSDLKAAIADVIKTNGNQEITGTVLQSTLNSIVNVVGENATFAGIATPSTNPGIPDGPVFYLAIAPGTYSNFNGQSVAIGEIAVFIYKTSWQKQSSSYEITEVNVSKIFPTGGIDGTNKYTLESAIAKIPSSLRNVGIKCSFIDEAGELKTWEYQGGTFTALNSWNNIGAERFIELSQNQNVMEEKIDYITSTFGSIVEKTKNLFNKDTANYSGYNVVSERIEAVSGAYYSINTGIIASLRGYATKGAGVAIGSVNFYKNHPAGPIDESWKWLEIQFRNDPEQIDPNTVMWELGQENSEYQPFGVVIKEDALPGGVATKKDIEELELKINAENPLSLPSVEYYLAGEENSIYFNSILKYKNDNYYVRLSSYRNSRRFSRITPKNNQTIKATVYDKDFKVIEEKQFSMIVSNKTQKTDLCKWLHIGDSYAASTVKSAISKLTNVIGVGTRQIGPFDGANYCEGYPGWKLWQATHQAYDGSGKDLGFSPFMQPANGRYYGTNIDARRALTVELPNVNGSNFKKTCERIGFNSDTGFLSNPQTNDCMWNHEEQKLQKWDGSSWVDTTKEEMGGFNFDFPKYLSTWGIDTPDIVSMNFGVNDFMESLPGTMQDTNITNYLSYYDIVINSVKQVVSKFIVVLPTSNLCAEGEHYKWMECSAAAYFRVRQELIKKYDNRTSEGIYIADCGAAIDDVYGFTRNQTKPFNSYTGDETEIWSDDVHPQNGGYEQFAAPLSGCIQYIRN